MNRVMRDVLCIAFKSLSSVLTHPLTTLSLLSLIQYSLTPLSIHHFGAPTKLLTFEMGLRENVYEDLTADATTSAGLITFSGTASLIPSIAFFATSASPAYTTQPTKSEIRNPLQLGRKKDGPERGERWVPN